MRCTDLFTRLYFRGTLRSLYFPFSKQVILLKVKCFQHLFLCCSCYSTGSMCFCVQIIMGSACDGSFHGIGQGRAALLLAGECPAWMERAIHPKLFIVQLFSLKAFLPWDSELLSWMGQEGERLARGSLSPNGQWGRGPGRVHARLSIPSSANCARPQFVLLWHLQTFLHLVLSPNISSQRHFYI